jgi:adenine-specific DNA-methyltransferase
MADASMLELYLSKVPDPELQAQLRAEIERTTTKFGLVFERHQPEGIRMPKAPIRRGSKVVDEGTGTFHRVLAINGEEAELVDADGTRTRQPLDGLTVAREFGDVMYPGLQPVHAIRRGKPSDPVHTVINGENYHALEMLQYTHANRVDLIYIDPPYNTGNKTWKYNDRYISEQDGYRHSKWLSFMEKRLKIARTLLKSTGVIIVAIGDEEHHRLRMLLDQVFGEQNFISDVVWQGGRKNDSRYVSNGADYMLIYGRDERALSEADVRWNEPRSGLEEIREAARSAWEESGHKQADATRIMKRWIAGLPEGHPAKENNRFYEFEPDGRVFRKKDISWPGGGGPRYDVIHPVTGKPVRVPSRGWIYSKPERMQQDIDAGLIFWGKDHTEFINRNLNDVVNARGTCLRRMSILQ